MTDKDVERNVRSTTVEGIKTPTERHVHGLGEQHSISYGEKSEARKTKESLLDKFRKRELKRTAHSDKDEREKVEPGETGAGEDTPQQDNGGDI